MNKKLMDALGVKPEKKKKPVYKCCSECDEKPVFVRHTQFAGSHPFCYKHAVEEKDFMKSDSYEDWECLEENLIFSIQTGSSEDWDYGKTYHGNFLFGKWCRFKGAGKPPVIDIDTVIATGVWPDPKEASQGYLDACKRWPYKDKEVEAAWRKHMGIK